MSTSNKHPFQYIFSLHISLLIFDFMIMLLLVLFCSRSTTVGFTAGQFCSMPCSQATSKLQRFFLIMEQTPACEDWDQMEGVIIFFIAQVN